MGIILATLIGAGFIAGSLSGTIMASKGLKVEKNPAVKVHNKRWESDNNGLTITVVDGMHGGAGHGGSDEVGDGIPRVAIYPQTSQTSSDIVYGDSIVVDADGSHTFAGSDMPDRIYVTNADTTPICVAGVYVTYPDNTTLVMSGNLGRVCGADNYESLVEVLPMPDASPSACVWVDRHHSNGIKLGGIAFDLMSKVDGDGESWSRLDGKNMLSSVEDLCTSPFMFAEKKKDNIKRSDDGTSPAPLPFKSQLVKSGLKSSSAARLCSERHTIGPDFVSLSEKLYCNMDTRRVYPLCEQGVKGLCFDGDQDVVVSRDEEPEMADQARTRKRAGGSTIEKRAGEVIVVKSFKHVAVWS